MKDDPAHPAPSAVRPYVITGGRSDSEGEPLSWETLVTATDIPAPANLQPEYRRILDHCQGLLSVAEVSAHLAQPAPVVQVLLADLLREGLIAVRSRTPAADGTHADTLEKVLHGLQRRL